MFSRLVSMTLMLILGGEGPVHADYRSRREVPPTISEACYNPPNSKVSTLKFPYPAGTSLGLTIVTVGIAAH